ncbi:MAG TPA: GNAT family N-acetyltransferase [Sphingomicrobium sp.]|jgi:RimJ/RimL family protein N-acetyltransferase|nr:GNAT family N-acetyltransferase [Sphingomicrobium sp.]
MSRSAPLLETERVRLRPFRRDDLDAMAEMLGDATVALYLGGVPATREESWRKLMMAVGQWPLLGLGYWAVETKTDGRFVGQIGFGIFERDISAAFAELPEMGWIFSPAVHGQGIALEAGRAALDWLEATRGPTASWAIISPGNVASLKLAERLGFARLPDALYHDEPIAVVHRSAR